jgi:transcription antitermination factor NusG
MSKAFDSVNRSILIKDLEKVLQNDELHIIKTLTEVELQVRNENVMGEKFQTNTGIPQGDSLSPVLFTFYLANALKDENDETKIHLPIHLKDHDYSKNIISDFTIDQQFADDVGYASTSKDKLKCVKIDISEKLETKQLIINDDKTEYYSINDGTDEKWKKCKYLGSLLDTHSDIIRRKQLSMASFKKYQNKLKNEKLHLKTRMKLFNTYVTSVFLYNSEIWTLTKKLEKEVDIFHRKLLRSMMNIRYPKTISNEKLYKITKEREWSNVIKTRRLRWTGHFLRLSEETPVWKAFKESNRCNKIQKKTSKLTWIKKVNLDLKEIDQNLSLNDPNIRTLAQDRDWWRRVIVGSSLAVSSSGT